MQWTKINIKRITEKRLMWKKLKPDGKMIKLRFKPYVFIEKALKNKFSLKKVYY